MYWVKVLIHLLINNCRWYRDLCERPKPPVQANVSSLWAPPSFLSAQRRITPKLLRLTWTVDRCTTTNWTDGASSFPVWLTITYEHPHPRITVLCERLSDCLGLQLDCPFCRSTHWWSVRSVSSQSLPIQVRLRYSYYGITHIVKLTNTSTVSFDLKFLFDYLNILFCFCWINSFW